MSTPFFVPPHPTPLSTGEIVEGEDDWDELDADDITHDPGLPVLDVGGVYLAGKITRDGKSDRHLWRWHFVDGYSGYRDVVYVTDWDMRRGTIPKRRPSMLGDDRLPILGPFSIGCDHGCGHSAAHTGAGGCLGSGEGSVYRPLFKANVRALSRARTCIAWIDGDDLEGTAAEIGIASMTGVKILLGTTRRRPFLEWMADDVIVAKDAAEFAEAVRLRLPGPTRPRLDSPLEEALYDAMPESMQRAITTQHVVGRYRLDFAFIDEKLCVEVDGRSYHSDEAAFTKDRTRDRWLMVNGWRVIRFAGNEVFSDARRCVAEIDAMRAGA